MNLNEEFNSNGSLSIDLNCDGINDLRIVGEADQDYVGSTTTKSSELRISTLNSNVFILLDSIIDSNFYVSNADTAKMEYNLFYRERYDRRIINSQFERTALAKTTGAEFNINSLKNQNSLECYRNCIAPKSL